MFQTKEIPRPSPGAGSFVKWHGCNITSKNKSGRFIWQHLLAFGLLAASAVRENNDCANDRRLCTIVPEQRVALPQKHQDQELLDVPIMINLVSQLPRTCSDFAWFSGPIDCGVRGTLRELAGDEQSRINADTKTRTGKPLLSALKMLRFVA